MDDADLYADLYADVDGPKLPSTTGLANELASTRAEREALEARLQSLRSDNVATRAGLEDLTRRACVILSTARLELKRKDEQLEDCQRQIQRLKKGVARKPSDRCSSSKETTSTTSSSEARKAPQDRLRSTEPLAWETRTDPPRSTEPLAWETRADRPRSTQPLASEPRRVDRQRSTEFLASEPSADAPRSAIEPGAKLVSMSSSEDDDEEKEASAKRTRFVSERRV